MITYACCIVMIYGCGPAAYTTVQEQNMLCLPSTTVNSQGCLAFELWYWAIDSNALLEDEKLKAKSLREDSPFHNL